MRQAGAALTAVLLAAFACTASAQPPGRWYKGDLHAHSTYSDGDSPVAQVLAGVTEKGLEFFALTDHDTYMDGKPKHWDDPAYASGIVTLLYGSEWTTPKGHANIWAPAKIAYDKLWTANQNQDPAAAIAEAHSRGALFSINHPVSLLNNWEYASFEGADSLEVWNATYRLPNLNGWAIHGLWDRLLQSRLRLAAVGGSDTHQLTGPESLVHGLGDPTTWVYAAEKTAEAILGGIKAGRTSVSYAPNGPRLDFRADADGDGKFEALIGANLPLSGRQLTFRIDVVEQIPIAAPRFGIVVEVPDGIVEMFRQETLSPLALLALVRDGRLAGVFRNGRLWKAYLLLNGATSVVFRDKPEEPGYYRVELIGKPGVETVLEKLLYGRVLAITSPIYLGYQ